MLVNIGGQRELGPSATERAATAVADNYASVLMHRINIRQAAATLALPPPQSPESFPPATVFTLET